MAGFNRNRKKKTYSFNRSQTTHVVSSSVNGAIEYFDETLVVIDNPYFVLDTAVSQGIPPVPPPPPGVGEYDESVIDFSWEDTKTAPFSFTFSSTPIVTLEILPAFGWENVAAYLDNVNASGLTVNLSAPLSGQIVYRAIYAPSYPTVVSRSVVSTSYYYTASAGYSDLLNSDLFQSSYSLLYPSTVPQQLFLTVRDINNNGDADVAVVYTGSYGLTTTEVSLSAPITNRVYYLAVKA